MKKKIIKPSNIIITLGILLIFLGAGNAWWTWQRNHSPLDTVYDSPQQLDSNQNALPLLQSEGNIGTPGAPTVNTDDPSGNHFPIGAASETGLQPDRIVIPVINLDAPVIPIHFIHVTVSSTTYEQWVAPNSFAAGWHDTSALLGIPGNTVLNGHHNSHGKVFAQLINLNIGDTIIVYSGNKKFEYQVAAKMLLPERYKSIQLRLNNARWIMPSDDERLTLVTCWPADNNTHRVVVVAYPSNSQRSTGQISSVVTNPTSTSPTTGTTPTSIAPMTSRRTQQGISLEISVSKPYYREIGKVLTYSYIIRNETTATLARPFSISDDLMVVSCPSKDLAPGKQITCSGTHKVTQADLDDGSITNNAVASGSGYVSSPASLTVYALPASGILLLNSSDPSNYDRIGQIIHYAYTIQNVGNVSLPGPFTVADDRTVVSCASSVLLPGESTFCTGAYAIQQADLDAGSVTSHARASMQTLTSNTARVTVYAIPSPDIDLTKSADMDRYTNIGQVIHYSYTIRNTGNITLSGPFSVTDDKLTVSCPAGRLAPGDTLACSASYTITQEDLDAGSITNSAFALGYFSGGYLIQSGIVQVTVTREAPAP